MALIKSVWVVTTSSKRRPLGLTHSFLHSVLVWRAVSQLYPWNCFVTFPALTHSLHASGFLFFFFLTPMQPATTGWRLYLNLLPSLNRCCCIHSTGPRHITSHYCFFCHRSLSNLHIFSQLLVFSLNEWTWDFCTKQGGLPGLPLFVRPVAGGFHLCDDSWGHIADT